MSLVEIQWLYYVYRSDKIKERKESKNKLLYHSLASVDDVVDFISIFPWILILGK